MGLGLAAGRQGRFRHLEPGPSAAPVPRSGIRLPMPPTGLSDPSAHECVDAKRHHRIQSMGNRPRVPLPSKGPATWTMLPVEEHPPVARTDETWMPIEPATARALHPARRRGGGKPGKSFLGRPKDRSLAMTTYDRQLPGNGRQRSCGAPRRITDTPLRTPQPQCPGDPWNTARAPRQSPRVSEARRGCGCTCKKAARRGEPLSRLLGCGCPRIASRRAGRPRRGRWPAPRRRASGR